MPTKKKPWLKCKKSPNGKHEADALSATQQHEYPFVVDYVCKHGCGWTGSVKIDPADIQFD
jgi:hypothetical protein